jgi:dynein heavy chain
MSPIMPMSLNIIDDEYYRMFALELSLMYHALFVGLFSVIMRDLANMSGDGPKWIVLDGDIDPMWIESLNTVMDDNKVLTLASNERIPLTPSMRLLFEISHLRTATPATVSRAGILFINPQDLGWIP